MSDLLAHIPKAVLRLEHSMLLSEFQPESFDCLQSNQLPRRASSQDLFIQTQMPAFAMPRFARLPAGGTGNIPKVLAKGIAQMFSDGIPPGLPSSPALAMVPEGVEDE